MRLKNEFYCRLNHLVCAAEDLIFDDDFNRNGVNEAHLKSVMVAVFKLNAYLFCKSINDLIKKV